MASTDCLDTKVEIFNALLTRVLDACAPFRSFTAKRTTSPWLTPDIKALIVARNRARRTWRRRRTFATHSIFKQLRNQSKSVIKAAKNAYYHRIFDNVRSNREAWSELRRLGLIRSKTQTSTLQVSPDALNLHFTNVGCVSSSPLRTEVFYLDSDSGGTEYSDGRFYLTDPSDDELIRALSTSTSRSVGVDGLSYDDIKRAMPEIVIAFNICFLTRFCVRFSQACGSAPSFDRSPRPVTHSPPQTFVQSPSSARCPKYSRRSSRPRSSST